MTVKKLFSENYLILAAIIVLGIFFRFYRLIPNIIFNGEMGTDYMNVLGMLGGTHSWLIGPRTSHEWFFIPPISYWVYTGLLLTSKFNPLIINFFWAAVGVLAIPVGYYYVKKLFDEKVAMISAFLLAVSPLWLIATRNARYNAPAGILFFPYLYYLWKSIKDKGKGLFILGIILGLTMSFFPSPVLLVPATIICFIFYRVKPKLKYVGQWLAGFLIPNITFIIYEFSDRFSITLQLLTWIPYRVLGFFGLYPKNTATPVVISENFYSIYQFFYTTFNGGPGLISLLLFISIIILSTYFAYRLFKSRNKEMPFWLLIINLLVVYLGLFVHGNPPDHYYLVIYPVPVILASFLIVRIFKTDYLRALFAIILGGLSIYYLISTNWFYTDFDQKNWVAQPRYTTQLAIDSEILKDSKGQVFTLRRIGLNNQFENDFALNYIYMLTIGGAKIADNSPLTYTIVEGTDTAGATGKQIWSGDGVEIFKSQNGK